MPGGGGGGGEGAHPSLFFCITIEFFSKSFVKGVEFSLAPSPAFQPVSEPMKLQAKGKRSNKNLSSKRLY